MINLDLIKETAQVAARQEPSNWALGLMLGICVLLAMAIAATIKNGDGKSLRVRDFSIATGVIMLTLGMTISIMLLLNQLAAAILIGVIAITTLVFATKRYCQKQWPDLNLRLAITWVAVTLALIPTVLLPMVPQTSTYSSVPTDAAKVELDRAEALIGTSITDTYDVEILEQFTNLESTNRRAMDPIMLFTTWIVGSVEAEPDPCIAAVESFLNSSPEDYPKVKLLTEHGVIGDYGVLYDNETGTSRLVITDQDTDLPVPAQLIGD